MSSSSDDRSRPRSSRGNSALSPAALHELIVAAGRSFADPQIGRLLRLAAAGRWDLVSKLSRSLVLAARRNAFAPPVPFPLPSPTETGGILLGNATDLVTIGSAIYLPLHMSYPHALITGPSGSGKSYFIKHTIQEHFKRNECVVWYFDAEDEARDIASLLPRDRLCWLAPDMMRLNLFTSPDAVSPTAWTAKAVSLLRAPYYMRDGSGSELTNAVDSLYAHGVTPTLEKVRAAVRARRFAKTSRRFGYVETCERVLQTLHATGDGLYQGENNDLIDLLTTRHCIFDVSGLDSRARELFVVFVLTLASYRQKKHTPILAYVEESHEIINPYRAGRSDLGEPPAQNLIRRLRKDGINLVLVDQNLGAIPESVIGSASTMVTFGATDWKSRAVIKNAMALTGDQAEVLSALPERVALCGSPLIGGVGLVRVPDIVLPTPQSQESLRREMAPFLAHYRPSAPESATDGIAPNPEPQNTAPDTPAPEKQVSVVARASLAEADSTTASTELGDLVEADIRYFKCLASHPLYAATAFDQAFGWKRAEGSRHRGSLLRRGFIAYETIQTGKRGPPVQVVRIEEAGHAFLKRLGIAAAPLQGKGGFEHQYFQAVIRRHLQKAFPEAEVRVEWTQHGKAADIGVRVGEEVHAYEVERSAKHTVENVVTDLDAGFSKVVLCAVKRSLLDSMRRHVNEAFASVLTGVVSVGDRALSGDDVIARVEYRLLGSFLE